MDYSIIPFNKLNSNNRMYTKESFKEDGIPKTIPIMSSFDPDAELVGQGKVVVKNDGIYLEDIVLDVPYNSLLENKLCRFASAGEGDLEDNKVVNFKLESAFISNNQNWAFEEKH